MRRTHLGSMLLAVAGAAGLIAWQTGQPVHGQINGFRVAAKAVTRAAAQQPALEETPSPPISVPASAPAKSRSPGSGSSATTKPSGLDETAKKLHADDAIKAKTARINIANMMAALDVFELDNGRYPTAVEGLSALIVQPAGLTGWKGPYLDAGAGNDPTKDPWGNTYNYVAPGMHNKDFDLSSSGPDGKAGDDDDIVNWK